MKDFRSIVLILLGGTLAFSSILSLFGPAELAFMAKVGQTIGISGIGIVLIFKGIEMWRNS